ncbi:MAG: hypothetical protein MUD01_02220 [Chloroflexaceae bacterium]|nr:hypothetical protein [Chloroflexaceae bacterium]
MVLKLLCKGDLTRNARIVAAAAGVALLLAVALPLWQMTMISNQYPEGLRVWIYTYKLSGDLQEINTLNHYIGMHPLEEAYFPELRILPFSFVLGGLLCLLAAALKHRWITTLVLVGGGLAGLATMSVLIYRLYTFGHNLDPRAAIDIAPFMPPPIGINQLANFRVTTFFHLGSILFILALVGLLAALWVSRPSIADRHRPDKTVTMHTLSI